MDALGTTRCTYDAVGQRLTEGGPFDKDTVTGTYSNRRRVALSFQQPTGSWTNGFGWVEAELGRRRKGDPEQVQIASRLRARTTMTLKWIARRLDLGAWTFVSNCLVQKRRQDETCQ